ncbi:MAG: hypothetical protein PHQ67_01265 [Fermentimonas sp.]|nr:hypothetical protein [Fermentimonas sp.]MDD4008421.1 hypothetical protein [Fermentimonas sp.]MDD4698075.1 hypothetical protein [Fermentimonas sp.]
MKKTGFVLFLMTVCIALVFPSTIKNANEVQDNWEDIVELSREGGTTRIARQSFSIQSFAVEVEPIVEAYMGKNAVTVSVQNYNGPVFVEIYGSKGATSSFFDVFNNGVGVVSLSGLGADEYRVRITLGDITYTGTIYKGKYGHRK